MKNKLLLIFAMVISILIVQITSCDLWKDECQKFCENPNRNEIYKNFPVEKQFEYSRTCLCWGDSISNKGFYLETLYKREDIVEFLVHKLKAENDPDILTDALGLLNSVSDKKYNVYAKDLRGRKDIAELAKKTAAKIPEKDERNLMDKLTGQKVESRKEYLDKTVKEIEENTSNNYEAIIETKDEKGK